MPLGKLGRATRRGIAWNTLTFAAGRAVTFLSVLVLARLLTPEDFGVVAAILVYLSVIELLSDLGMKSTVVYEQEQGVTERVQTAFTLNAGISLLLAIPAVLAAPQVAALFDMGDQADLFRLASLSLVITGLGNVHDSLLMRELAFKRRVFPQIARAVVRAGVAIWLALAGLEAAALVWGLLAGALAWTALQWILTPFRPTFRFDRGIARSMFGYASGALAVQVLAAIGTRLDTVVISRVLGAHALGLYTIAFRVPELLIEAVAWNVSQVAFPALSRKRSTDDKPGVARSTLKLFRYQALYAAPVAAGLAILAPPLVVVLFSSAWREAGGVMSAVAVMAGISAITFPLGDVFRALDRQRLYVVLMLVEFPLFAGAIIVTAPYGILAVAWARAGVDVFHAAMVTAVVLRILGVRARDLARAAGPAVVTALGVAAGAGAVRLSWPDLAFGPVALGSLAGGLAGLAALRLLARDTYAEVRTQLVGRIRPSSRMVEART